MTRTVYVDGEYLPYANAGVHAEDRGFQFGDGVYEVCEVRDRAIIDERRHVDRLARSLEELDMSMPMSRGALGNVMRETRRRNRVEDGLVYLQVTRGAAPRDFLFPSDNTRQTVVCLARHIAKDKGDDTSAKGIGVLTVPEARWSRVDIKTVMLLASCMAKEKARAADAKEAWFVAPDGHVTEGASSNAWIVTMDGMLVTRPPDGKILNGITRTVALEVAAAHDLELDERPFTVEEAKAAREAFVTSASAGVMPVTAIDGSAVANGEPGAIATSIRAAYHTHAEHS
ncbi:MAG: D-amino-acid transaminase [Pseudomonadota bacterium]